MPSTYYEDLQAAFQGRRDTVMDMLNKAGFRVFRPQGSYFVLADWRDVAPSHIQDDVQFARWLTTEIGVACIPPSAFYQNSDKHLARHLARFAVCKKDDTLQAAAERLRKLDH
jgi:aspartate/methionine/tyrosine aminotransferase